MHDTRIAFVDTNWLIAIYHGGAQSSAVKRWADSHAPSNLVISEAVMAECRCNFRRIGNRLGALESDLRAGLFTDCGYTFRDMSALADELFSRYAPRCNVGTLDLLHVAAAKRFGCRWFLSFDSKSGCRAVAHMEKLKLFPEISQADRNWVNKLK